MEAPAIRAATVEDVPLILRFIRELAAYERLSSAVVADEARLAASLFGPAPEAEVLIAEVGATPVGFALFFHNYSTFLGQRGLYLEDLFVLEEWRGRGIGRALLVRLARLALERGCGRFEWSVLDWNAPAIRFYCDLGAEPQSEWTTFRLTGPALARLAAGGVEPKSSPMNHAEARRLCDRWGPLWTGNRPEDLAQCYSEDVFYRDPATPDGLNGRPALLAYLRKLLARNPDWVWTMEEIYPTDGGFCVRWLARIPVGQEVVVEKGLDLVLVKDGFITRNEVYFDRTALLEVLRAARAGAPS